MHVPTCDIGSFDGFLSHLKVAPVLMWPCDIMTSSDHDRSVHMVRWSLSCVLFHCKIKIFAQISESKIIEKWFVLLNSIKNKNRRAKWWIWTWFTAGWTTCIARTFVQTKSMCPIAITYAARIWSTLCNAAFQCIYTRIFALQSQVVVSMNESEIR